MLVSKEAIIVLSVIILFIAFLSFILWPWGIYYGYSEGERTGEVFKFSYKGLFWKSWEGTLYLGGLVKSGEGVEIEKFHFSIPKHKTGEKAEVIERLKTCATQRLNCTIQYNQWLIAPWWLSTSYEVENVTLPK